MKFLILLLISSVAGAQSANSVATENGAVGEKKKNAPIYGLSECRDYNLDHKTIDDFAKTLKAGELIDPQDLVNNPNFLDPCFMEVAGIYSASFEALKNLSRSISSYTESETVNITNVNSQYEKLGTERNAPKKAKATEKKVYKGPYYSKDFKSFEKKAKLIGTVENDGGFLAHIRYGEMPLNDIKIGDIVKGVEIVNIEFGRVTYKDLSASKKSKTIWVGG